ncbi:MAG TPA: hypothetical protein VGR15_02765 [Bacteroidota bacterium]|jgi:Tol biopolymer transport system component|nr:hypothetical protein [Bacteroidota bacterium]
MSRRIATYVLLVFLLRSSAPSQFFYFGRNKVQYTAFDWHVLKTDHFDIYYYPEMKDLAERGAFMAEESYRTLEEKFNHNVSNRIPLIFYSSHLHFQQTNTTPGFVPEGVGGFFEFLKGRVVIPYDGSMWNFRHVIRHELVHVFMHSKINRVLLDHRIAQDHLPPLWFVEGLAEYWSTHWDGQAEMVLRDAVVSNYLVPLSDLERIFGTYLMYKEGQNILQFAAERFGPEKILLFMENFWKSGSFEDVFKLTLDRSYQQFDEEWTYALKKKYYPLLASLDQPSGVSKPLVTEGFNSKPVYYRNGDRKEIYFIGNHSGYTSIYRATIDSGSRMKTELVLEGEKTDEFEAFHLFQSKLDISVKGILAFITKSGENDALHLYDIKNEKVVETNRFKDLVVLGSPSWSPDGERIVFSSVDKSGNNDLYIWDTGHRTLERLTNDIYDERDPSWSPRGDKIVFSSDRTPYGEHGKYNLFLFDLNSRDLRYLTYGDESYHSPQWSPDGTRLLFTSDIDGARNVWMMNFDTSQYAASRMRKITQFTTAAFDPSWADSTLIFVAFENFSFQIRAVPDVMEVYDSSKTIRPLDASVDEKPWKPHSIAGTSEVNSLRYTGEYSLDIAQSQIATDPVFGTSGGAFLALSDLLGNEQYYFLVYNTAQTTDELLSSFNIAVSRISLQQRTNFAYGVYRFSGRRYDLSDPDEFFFERVFGGYFTLSYPLSKFRRIAVATSLSNSEKDATISDLSEASASTIDRSRRALFLSNTLSFTHDNSLWGPSGPLDGNRFNISLAYTSDIQYSNASYYSVIFDYRHYFRIAQRSALASRLWLFYNDGKEARRFVMGGSWDLRGFPRFSLRGKKLWLVSNELRFPFLDQLGFRFPFGGVSFVGFRGALFFDVGNAWDDEYTETLGSLGGGLRFNLAGVLVLRYDIGKRIERNFTRIQDGLFHQFFFGYDF